MEGFVLYRKRGLTEMRPWSPDYPMANISVSVEDRANGSPKSGDMIARDPSNHEDKWLVSRQYFEINYERV